MPSAYGRAVISSLVKKDSEETSNRLAPVGGQGGVAGGSDAPDLPHQRSQRQQLSRGEKVAPLHKAIPLDRECPARAAAASGGGRLRGQTERDVGEHALEFVLGPAGTVNLMGCG